MIRFKRSMSKLFGIVWGILREIGDESAYDRHLRAHGRPHTPAEWRHFQIERARLKYQNPRCC